MKVYYENKSLQDELKRSKSSSSVGFVPTMGALHEGHLSLIKKANEENEIVVVSIYVNPTQFDKKEDLIKYPRTLEKDIKLLETIDGIIIFAPSTQEIYSGNIIASHFDFDGLEFEMEGKHRKGHFDGVGTIVKRLFEIIKPHRAYFGEKDFQQLLIVKKLVEKHQLPVKIIGCEIFRENDGLATSSRNSRLTKSQRDAAPFIYRTLKEAKRKFKTDTAFEVHAWVQREFKKDKVLKLEYFEIATIKTLKSVIHKRKNNKYRAFIATFAGNIRLIDNIALN